MKVFDLATRVSGSGEVSLGPQETGALTTYLLYGVLAPFETGRRLRPGRGREEILFVIDGELRLEGDTMGEVQCSTGTAVLLPEGSSCWVSNARNDPSRYVLAGGFTEPAHFLRQVQQQAVTTAQQRR